MKPLKTLSICLVALVLHSPAWAEIYETKEADGETEFTDSPPAENAEVVDLQQTNIVDAPAAEPQDTMQQPSQPGAGNQVQVEENNIVIHRDGYDDGAYEDGEYVGGVGDVTNQELRREEDAIRRADPDAPHEVGDAESQMPREVGDSESQMPREVGDMPVEIRENNRAR